MSYPACIRTLNTAQPESGTEGWQDWTRGLGVRWSHAGTTKETVTSTAQPAPHLPGPCVEPRGVTSRPHTHFQYTQSSAARSSTEGNATIPNLVGGVPWGGCRALATPSFHARQGQTSTAVASLRLAFHSLPHLTSAATNHFHKTPWYNYRVLLPARRVFTPRDYT